MDKGKPRRRGIGRSEYGPPMCNAGISDDTDITSFPEKAGCSFSAKIGLGRQQGRLVQMACSVSAKPNHGYELRRWYRITPPGSRQKFVQHD